MTDALRFVPPRVPITDQRGMITREWYLFFQGIFDRIGGATGPSIPDVDASLFEDAGTSETNASLFALADTLAQAAQPTADTAETMLDSAPRYEQYTIDVLTSEVGELRELVAVLFSEIQALKQSSSM